MRFSLPCFTCLRDPKAVFWPGTFGYVEFNDEGVYQRTCPRGHTQWLVPHVMPFELLFDIATHAILDGYYREAVTTYASSVERFFEHAIRVMLRRADPEGRLVGQAWNQIAKQSERQLGAFVCLWTANFTALPSLVPKSQVEFRNAVVHKGEIPTKQEACTFGAACLAVIRPQLYELLQAFPAEDEAVAQEWIQAAISKLPAESAYPGTKLPTLLSRQYFGQDNNTPSFDELLASHELQRKIERSAEHSQLTGNVTVKLADGTIITKDSL